MNERLALQQTGRFFEASCRGKKVASIKISPFASSMPSLHSALIMMDLQLMGSEMERSRRQTCLLHRRTCIVILCAVLHGVRELWVAWLQRGENRAEERLHMSEILWLVLAQNDLETKTNQAANSLAIARQFSRAAKPQSRERNSRLPHFLPFFNAAHFYRLWWWY